MHKLNIVNDAFGMKHKMILLLTLLLMSCNRVNKSDPASMIGTKLWMPEEICQNVNANKIVAYYDFAGCLSCELKEIKLWQDKLIEIERLRNDFGADVSLFFIVNTPEYDNIADAFEKLHPYGYFDVIYDKERAFEKHNILPEKSIYDCFLIDSKDRICLIGNPLFSEVLWNKYVTRIKGKRR